ncbi:unnamed protein product [Nippostrongylus brasiliensis]|uniref:FBD domain-containing protein n=1 Tax=Nippostrongylus brasiliensis TaxID=27835 RepID=A0A158QXX6_NIPBR|nr:unnamed protein product [Nippostrongylus brasiliensis]
MPNEAELRTTNKKISKQSVSRRQSLFIHSDFIQANQEVVVKKIGSFQMISDWEFPLSSGKIVKFSKSREIPLLPTCRTNDFPFGALKLPPGCLSYLRYFLLFREPAIPQVICAGPLLLTLPDILPSAFEVLIVQNASIRSVPKHAFRRMDRLREVHFEHCEHLTFLEKFAFRAMSKLRLISFVNCPRLNEIPKSSFSGIGNDLGVRIQFHRTPIQRVHSGAFRNAQNIRELSISGSDLALSRHAFASITQELNCEIPPRAFEDLAHVHQVGIFKPEIVFIGLCTCLLTEAVLFFFLATRRKKEVKPIINLGRIRIARNHIQNLQTVESVLSTALQTRIEENTIECSCDLQWMNVHETWTKAEKMR